MFINPNIVMLGSRLEDSELENSTVTNYCLCPAVILQCIFICILFSCTHLLGRNPIILTISIVM